MKKSFSYQSIILSIAFTTGILFTIIVGTSSDNPFRFYWNTALINITFMGDVFYALAVSCFLYFYFEKRKLALNLLITVLFVELFVQALKNFFSDAPLQFFFESGIVLESRELFYKNFVSSHTAIAFTLAIFFAKCFKKVAIAILLFAIACVVVYTRIVFANDSVLSIAIGILPATFSFLLINKLNTKQSSNRGYYYKSKNRHSSHRKNVLPI